jgi:CxxC-x17-CxxC domain-containing protein
MQYSDKWINCAMCGRQFLWDAGEQFWYRTKKLEHQPRHCKACRDVMRDQRHSTVRAYTQVNCERCGDATPVPFVPRGTKPVYCRTCMSLAI